MNDFLTTASNIKTENATCQILYTDKKNDQISVHSKVVSVQNYQCSAVIDKQQEFELKDLFGIDIKEKIKSILNNENSINKNSQLYSKYKKLGEDNYAKRINKWKKFLFNHFKVKITSYVESKNLGNKILSLSHFINYISNLGNGDFCVISNEMASHIIQDSRFVHIQNSNELVSNGIRKIGTLVYVNIYVNDYNNENIIIIGRSTSHNDPGVYYVNFNDEFISIPITNDLIEIGSGYSNSPEKICLNSRYCIVDIGNSDNNYWTENITIRKKPLWRRFLFA
jgi:hypothetical protein